MKTMSKPIRLITAIPFAFLLMFLYYDTVFAREPILTIDLNTNTYVSFHTPRTLSANTLRPFMDETGNVLIPLRFLEEMKVSMLIGYKESDDWVNIYNYDFTVTLQVGSPTYKISSWYTGNGLFTFTDASGNAVAPRIINNRLYLPLRAILEQAYGFTVEYSGGVVNVSMAPATGVSGAMENTYSQPGNADIPAPVIMLPERIQALRKLIYNMHDRRAVYNTVYEQYGIYDTDAGSGTFIPMWFLDEGRLLFHPFLGVVYINSEGTELQLVKTENRLLETVMGARKGVHDVFSLPDEQNYGTSIYMGTLDLKSGGEYFFQQDTHNDSMLQSYQREAFFLKHNEGQWNIKYENGFNENTVLESLGYGVKVATITFTASGATIASEIATIPGGITCDKAGIKCTLDSYYVNGPWPYTS